MRMEKLVYSEYIHGKQFPVGTIILRLNNKTEIACSNFYFIKGKLEIFVYKPFTKWQREFSRNQYTQIMYKCFCKGKRTSTTVDYSKLMKHDRAHKKSGGGKMSPIYIVTDYECRKVPMHDFQRCYY